MFEIIRASRQQEFRVKKIALMSFVASLLAPVYAEEPSETGLEPEVKITQKGKNRIEEYSVNGHIYKVKITPPIGKPYYLIDTDGDGYMDARHDVLKNPQTVPQWILLEW